MDFKKYLSDIYNNSDINKITLSFLSSKEEESYINEHFEKSLKINRLEILLVVFLYGIFGILDVLLVPEFKIFFLKIRFFIVIPILLITFLWSYHKSFKNIWQYLISASFVFVGVGISVMIVTAPNNYTYYLGLMLVFSGTYFISNLRIKFSTITSLVNLVVFNFLYLFFTNSSIEQIIAVNFFYVAANLINLFAAYHTELFNRNNFILNKELAKERNNLEIEVLKRTEKLQNSEFQFRTLADFTYDWEYWVGIDNKIIYMSPSCERITGYTVDDFKNIPDLLNNIILDSDIDNWNNHINEFLTPTINSNDEKIIFRIKQRNGNISVIEHTCRAIVDSKNNYLGRRVSNKDITERTQLEEKIFKNEIKLKSMVGSISDVISIIDKDFVNIYISPNIEKIYGWTPEEILNFKTTDKIHPDEIPQINNLFYAIVEKPNYIHTSNCRYLCKDGSYKWIEFTINNLIHDEIIGGCLVNFRDITQKKLDEEALIIAKTKAEESNLLKTAFLNNIRHEIRTPINGIIGFLSFLKDDNIKKTEKDEIINIISKSSMRLIKTVDDIVEISAIQRGQIQYFPTNISINYLMSSIYEKFKSLADAKGLSFRIKNKIENITDDLESDYSKLFEILSFLVDNAIKFTKRGYIRIDIECDDNSIIFAIKDTGVGIEDNFKDSIFEIFTQFDPSQTRSFEGSGLGLSIANEYAKLINGKISFESTPGKGSTFYLRVPK